MRGGAGSSRKGAARRACRPGAAAAATMPCPPWAEPAPPLLPPHPPAHHLPLRAASCMMAASLVPMLRVGLLNSGALGVASPRDRCSRSLRHGSAGAPRCVLRAQGMVRAQRAPCAQQRFACGRARAHLDCSCTAYTARWLRSLIMRYALTKYSTWRAGRAWRAWKQGGWGRGTHHPRLQAGRRRALERSTHAHAHLLQQGLGCAAVRISCIAGAAGEQVHVYQQDEEVGPVVLCACAGQARMTRPAMQPVPASACMPPRARAVRPPDMRPSARGAGRAACLARQQAHMAGRQGVCAGFGCLSNCNERERAQH